MTIAHFPPRHIVTLADHPCRFGNTVRPVCECGYRGPLVSVKRGHSIAAEHRAKERGTWRPVR